MRIGSRLGSRGVAIGRLHRVLAGAGFDIAPGEVAAQEFGATTLNALHEFQRSRQLPETEEIDAATLAVLIRLEQNIVAENVTINVYEGPAPAPAPPQPSQPQGKVTGTLVDEDGIPIADAQVVISSVQLRAETRIGQGAVNKDGVYAIVYDRTGALNLIARAYDAKSAVIATSPTLFSAPAQAQINLTTAKDGVIRPLSVFANVQSQVMAQLNGAAFGDLKENKSEHEIQFVASSIGTPFTTVAELFIAHVAGAKNGLRDETLFGIFYQGIPASLGAALGALPDAGIDDTFVSLAFSGVLAHSRGSLSQALSAAVGGNILPASYSTVQDNELTRLDALRMEATAATPYIRGKTPVSALLAAGAVAAEVQTAFLSTYSATGGRLGPTWKALRANKTLSKADLATLNTTLSVGELLTGNLPLINDTLQRLTQKTLARVSDLALLDQNDWIARIGAIDPQATSIPQVLPTDTAPQRIARFAKSLAERFAGRYPTTAFVGGLTKAATSSFTTKAELISVLSANPTLNLKRANIDQFVSTKKLTLSTAALAELKTAQRLYRISPHYASAEALNSAGYTSAKAVYFAGRAPFVAQMTSALGSASLAKMAYARAQMTYTTTLTLYGRFNHGFNPVATAAFASPTPPPGATANFPDLQALFGSQDYFECEDCQSIYSPAAYLVDLLQYLAQFSVTAPAGAPASIAALTNARDAFLVRRPEVQYIALDCGNTNTTLPYIDLVNEILEAAVYPPPAPPQPYIIETLGTSAERRAIPQTLSQDAYAATLDKVFPLSLPFDLPFAQTTAYLAAMGTSRPAVMALFAGAPAGPSAADLACASLGLNPKMHGVIIGTDTHQPWERWGFSSQNNPTVLDPETRATFTPVTWIAALSQAAASSAAGGGGVPVLLNRSGLSLQQLYQLLEAVNVTQSAVTLNLGVDSTSGLVSASTELMSLNGVSADFFDRAQRFLRLLNATGLQMWELDWALEGQSLNDAFLVFLAGAIAIKTQLNLPLQDVLSFWAPLELRDVTDWLGQEPAPAPSTYSKVFANPTMLASWAGVFPPAPQPAGAFDLNGAAIVPAQIDPDTAQSANLNSVSAALGLSAADIAAVLAATTPITPNVLTLATVNVLLRYQRLANALSLSVADLILWIELAAATPFGTTPADTAECLRRIAVLRGTRLGVRDLDYLLRNQSATLTALAFTPSQATLLLQSIRDAVAKAVTASAIAVTQATNASPIVVATAAPHELATGMKVEISGALGNTAANGAFTVTVISPNSFTLNGSTGNAPWSGGGVAIPMQTVAGASNTTPVVIATETPHGLESGAQVWISGALGNTAANGLFSIAVTAANGFTLIGSAGNGDWTSGGSVATGVSLTIESIVLQALVAASSSTANVVTPVLNKIGILPLSATTIAQFLQNPTVDPTQFPQLVSAFTSVTKAGALFNALGATVAEFNFVVQNASAFGWLDPSALPSTNESPYAEFEALVRAIKLDQRQSAVTPKLFDVLSRWLAPGQIPTSVAGAIGTAAAPGLAFALDATPTDTATIAAALAAAPPSLTPATRSGSLADTAMLTLIANALDLVARYKMSGSTLALLATPSPIGGTAAAAFGAFQALYQQSSWFGAVQPIEDNLRQMRRDALVAYLLGPGANSAPLYAFATTDDIYNYFLIDPEMCACAVSTRLLQASLAIQQFVQQAFLNLSIQVTVDTKDGPWNEWYWRQQYRLWQANREVFLYPENYVLPETRSNASSFFTDMEGDLRQASCNEALAETALENYMRKLVDVSHLVVAAHYNETTAAGIIVLHVFAHTRAEPWIWYYRTRTTIGPSSAGAWSAWQALSLDIKSDQLVPIIWDQRLHVVWLIFKQESEKQRDQPVPAGGGGSQPAAAKLWSVDVAMSELSAGQWQPKRVIAEKMFFAKNIPGVSVDYVDRPQKAFTLRATQDPNFNLVITVYYNLSFFELIPEPLQIIAQSNLSVAQLEYDAVAVGVALGTASASALAAAQANLDAALNAVTAAALIGVFGDASAESVHVATGTLSMPESPMVVIEDSRLLPGATLVDLSQEPTFALVTSTTFGASLATPFNYNFSAQDLVWGYYYTPNPGKVSLNVLAQGSANGKPATIELLGEVYNPRIVVPPQEAVFDSLDPFFVVDGGGESGGNPRPARIYLVQPEFYTVSSSPQELDSLNYVKQWTTKYQFQTFYHPFARTMLRELEIGGVPQMMARALQTDPQSVRGWSALFDFNSLFQPQPPVATPYPGQNNALDVAESALDFSPGGTGAYALYNWELFYHGPMFTASMLSQNQQFQDAMNWYEYIFNPTDSSGGVTPQRFWEMAPFFQLNSSGPNGWIGQQIQNILQNLAQEISDPDTSAALYAYANDPFDPHAIASLRISAYAKATVMKFLDNVIAWGDSLFSNYTAETVGQAEQLYVLADMILGPAPNQVTPPATSTATTPATFAQIKSQLNNLAIDDPLVAVENLVVAPAPPSAMVQGAGGAPTLPLLPVVNGAFLFCIPPNQQWLAYWTTVADRLYKIRHCMNLQGQVVPLPLYAPPINPLLAAEMAAAGQSPSGLSPPAPIYRFTTYLQKAVDLTNDVRAFGALILAALEKEDAESLSVLRANQELDIQTRMLDVKNLQVTEADDQITALKNQKAVSQVRYEFYSNQQFTNACEALALALQGSAYQANGLALPLDLVAMEANMVPSFSFGVAGAGGTPEVTASFGGGNIAGSANAAASALRAAAGQLSALGAMAGTLGGFQRRSDDWILQADVAQAEMTQIDSLITAADDRLSIANGEVSIQDDQISNAQVVSDFLTNKYTNAQLYDWMVTQLTTVYTQAYHLAYGMAQQAQAAYQFELGRYQDSFLQFGYWDSQHRGLTAGESMLFDLRRMEAQYLAMNARELELTKHISLAITQPMALVQLMQTGTCQIYLDEALFDADHPGHYFRRLRSVAVTIPCVTGPYTGVNADLTLTTSILRTTSTLPAQGYTPATAQSPPTDFTTFSVANPIGATISTSSGQNDAGLFEVNLRDERWLPFEGQGAVSAWALALNPASNDFDFSTITDVVLHVRYTARPGIAESTVLAAVAPPAGVARAIVVSVKGTFGDALYSFFNPTNTTATQQTLNLPITNSIFPWSNIRSPQINKMSVFFALSQPPGAGASLAATFGPSGGAASPVALTTALPAGWSGTPALLFGEYAVNPQSAPQSYTLTLPTAGLPAELTTTVNGQVLLDQSKVEDVVMIISYVS